MLWKATFPLEVLEEDNKASAVYSRLIGQQFLFGRQQGEVLGEFLWGEMLAHRFLSRR
jgi:hypothetical protein